MVVSGYFGNEWRVIDKFGQNGDIDTGQGFKDIVAWATGTNANWTPLTSAETMDVVSSSTADDGSPAGTGAQTMTIQGLDSSYNEIEETITLDGTTTVTTSNSFLRVYRAFIVKVGSGGVNAGNITISATTAGTTQGYIRQDDGQTLQAIYTIPAGYTGFLYKANVSTTDTNKYVESHLQIRKLNGDGNYEAWRTKHHTDVVGETIAIDMTGSIGIPEKSDVRWQANSTGNNTQVCVGFKIMMHRN